MNKRLRDAAIIIFNSVVLVGGVDFLFGAYVYSYLFEGAAENESEIIPAGACRVKDEIYHHGLKSSFIGTDSWEKKYDLCTNEYGMKAACEDVRNSRKAFDIAFIGDSFTEGIGLPYQKTFVGIIAKSMPEKAIANLGVASYSPSIYLTKVKHFLEQGFQFKEVIIYIDISDIQDEAIYYSIIDGKVKDVTLPHDVSPPAVASPPTNAFARKYFPLSYELLHQIKARAMADPSERMEREAVWNELRSAWTYRPDSPGYGPMGIERGIAKAVGALEELFNYLDRRGIPLSVGVYPWPAQLRWDTEDSRQVQIWRKFCERRCKHFFNSFPSFFRELRRSDFDTVYRRYYIARDTHYNESGNEILARDFLTEYTR